MARDMKIVKIWDVEPTPLEGGARSRRLLTRKSVDATVVSMGVVFCDPGEGHDWHSHPPGEEEALYVIQGKGIVSWERDGEVVSQEIKEGYAIFTPIGAKNKLVNTGSDPLVAVWAISPPR